ncbi:MAG: sporulation peptidase YabG [Firmicutes bacterium]|nr:sporulation peptidase YabG [Bacillota bacterium]
MEKISVGDTVSRISYGADLLFTVVRIFTSEKKKAMAHLKGLNVRLFADAPLSDLVKVDPKQVEKVKLDLIKQSKESARKIFLRRITEEKAFRYRAGAEPPPGHDFFELPGKVLHIDGDKDYLKDCLEYYRQLNVPVIGEYVPEDQQPARITSLLQTHLPEILVLTGHDGLLTRKASERAGIDSYRTSRYFVEAVVKARRFQPDKDALVIIAGACQSHYEALIAAGANFASSPERVFIHAYDPILVAEKVSYTPIDSIVHVYEAIEGTITGIKGIGGIETRGKFRLGLPKTPRE